MPGDLAIQLPPLPKTLLEAVELMNQPQGPEFEQVIDLVEHDPAVVTRLLRMVNSVYYGQRRPITSLHRAVTIMGAVPVIGIVLGMSLQQAKVAQPARRPWMHLIRHSVATAFLARHLGSGGTKGRNVPLFDEPLRSLTTSVPRQMGSTYPSEAKRA